MSLQVTGKVFQIMPSQTGNGSKGTWVKQEFVIETADQYPKKIALSAWGEKIVGYVDTLKEGDEVTVSFNPESREYNGKWFTDLRAWKIEKKGASSTQKTGVGVPQEQEDDSQDLPF
jgi:hypothetical protein